MANGFASKDATASTVEILTKEVVHAGLGITGQEQVMIQADGVSGQNLAAVDSSGAQLVDQRPSGTATQTSVSSATSDQTLLAANAARRYAVFANNSSAILYIRLGGVATTTTAFTVAVPAGQYWEIPGGYTGVAHGIWASVNGNCNVTEITA